MKKFALIAAVAIVLTLLAPTQSTFAGTLRISNSSARSQVYGDGMSVYSSGGCQDRNNSSCTSLEQVHQHTIYGIITLHHACGNCTIVITGGTEVGHASGTYSHYNGYKLDIRHYSGIDSYIKGNFSYIGLRGDGAPQWQSGAGNVYADEGSHWDITFYNCGGCGSSA
jgi:hypothetical protein